MKAIDRLYEYLEYKDVKPTRFEKNIGLSNGYLGTQKKRNADLGEGVMNQIIDNSLDINPEWLLTGKGEMLKAHEVPTPPHPVIPSIDGLKGIPYFEKKIQCGSPSEFNECILANDFSSVINIPSVYGDFSLVASGDSMVNFNDPARSISSGDILIFDRVKGSTIHWGEVYAISTQDGFIIKKIMPCDNDGHILCVSFNCDLFPAFELPTIEINGIAKLNTVIHLTRW